MALFPYFRSSSIFLALFRTAQLQNSYSPGLLCSGDRCRAESWFWQSKIDPPVETSEAGGMVGIHTSCEEVERGMLTVDQYEYIRVAHRVYGKKIKEIARDTGHSRNTIKKALRGEYKGYDVRAHQAYPVLGPYLSIIDSWLEADKDRPKKQRHTAKRVYDRLRYEHGFEGSSRTVRRYVHDGRRRLGLDTDQVFIPLDPELGVEAEGDWGTCHAILGGEYVKLKMFCMRSKGSGKHLVQCFPCERQQAFFEGHIRAFSFFHGVFPVLIYDNLTTAVEKVLRGKNRKLQESFVKFHAYYNFTPRFCNPGQGHEKGGVEGLVGYSRRNYMVPLPEADSLEDFNLSLWEQCMAHGEHRIAGREKTVNELYEEEKTRLLPLPQIPFSNIESYSGKADKYSTVIVDKNRYSVPTQCAGLKVQAIVCVDRVEIFQANKKIASHRRLYGNNKWQLDPLHYLKLISRRPLAFSAALVPSVSGGSIGLHPLRHSWSGFAINRDPTGVQRISSRS